MQLERNKDGTYKVWMDREEYRVIPRVAKSDQHEIALRLMGDCGLRRHEVLDVTPSHITPMKDEEHYSLEVVSGKDTTGEYAGGRMRETWMPDHLRGLIREYCHQEGHPEDAPLIDRTERTVLNWTYGAAERAADETGDVDYRKVSTHDLRRSWATHLLLDQGVEELVVMELGGWGNRAAMEPYLSKPTEDAIIDSMRDVDL